MTEQPSEAAEQPAEPAESAAAAHRHTWRGYVFDFDGEHPIAEQRCACGASRTIRAWERYWDPTDTVQRPRNEESVVD